MEHNDIGAYNIGMVRRTAVGYLNLLREQYALLGDAVEDFYAGKEVRAIDISVRIRTLVHGTSSSTPYLSFIDPDFWDLMIYHLPRKKDHPDAVLVIKQPIMLSADGAARFQRPTFVEPGAEYELAPIRQWWTEEYLVLGSVRSSKKQIVLDLANKDGGAHVDEDVPKRHAFASFPPVRLGSGDKIVQPNLARATVAQAGEELRECIERHFPGIK
jgi:hypothetical protein